MTTTQRVADYLKTADLMRVRHEDVAGALSLTYVTLNRRLRNEGTRYSDLLEAERKRRVVELLQRNPHADAWKVSDVSGLTTRANLTREFRRWFGVNFREFRAHQKARA